LNHFHDKEFEFDNSEFPVNESLPIRPRSDSSFYYRSEEMTNRSQIDLLTYLFEDTDSNR